MQTVTTHTRKITTEAREFSSKLDDFVKVSNQHITNIRTETEQYRAKELETLAGISKRINEQIEKVQEALKIIRAKEQTSDEAVQAIHMTMQETQEGVKTALGSWADTMRQHCEETCKEAETSMATSCQTVSNIRYLRSLLAHNYA